MNKIFFILSLVALFMSGCAARPAPRLELAENLPSLDKGWSRIYVSAGKMSGVKLWSVHQVGPVFINNQQVGSTAKNEHFVVDLLPGTYEAYCTPEKPEKNYVEKRQFTFNENESRYLACDQAQKGLGLSFGLIGALASDYLYKTYLEEKKSVDSKSKLVAYTKLIVPGAPSLSGR